VRAFFRFWYGFVVGDDWRLAVAAVAALGLTALAVSISISAWWVAPLVLTGSLALVVLRDPTTGG
jgi:hypothetical protein